MGLQIAHVVLGYLLDVLFVPSLNILLVYVKQIESNDCNIWVWEVKEILLRQHLDIALEVDRVVNDPLNLCYRHALQQLTKRLVGWLCPDDVS